MSEFLGPTFEHTEEGIMDVELDRRQFIATSAAMGGARLLTGNDFTTGDNFEDFSAPPQYKPPKTFSRRDLFRLKPSEFQTLTAQESLTNIEPIIHLEPADVYLNQANIYPYENGGKISDKQINEVVNFYKEFNDFGNLTPNQIYTLVTQAALNHNESSIVMFEPPYDLAIQMLTADVITDHMFPTGETKPTTIFENSRAITPYNGIPFTGLKSYNPYTINGYLFAKGKQLSKTPEIWNLYKDIAGNAMLRQSRYLQNKTSSPKFLGCFNGRKILDPASDGRAAQSQQINWINQMQNVKAYGFNKGGNIPWYIAGVEIPEYINDPYNKSTWQAFEKYAADISQVIKALKAY